MAGSYKKAVDAALVGNGSIAINKFIARSFSRLDTQIKTTFPPVTRVFIEAETWKGSAQRAAN